MPSHTESGRTINDYLLERSQQNFGTLKKENDQRLHVVVV